MSLNKLARALGLLAVIVLPHAPVFASETSAASCGAAGLAGTYERLANGDSEFGFNTLSRCSEQMAGNLRFDLYLGISALEVSEFMVAQGAFKRLAKARYAGTFTLEQVAVAYRWIAERRYAVGSTISSNSWRYLNADPAVLLNINFNRKAIGLPHVLPVAGAPNAGRIDKQQSVAAAKAADVVLSDAVKADLQQAKLLLQQGMAAEAYALLAPHEFDYAGHVEFDYVLGTAAVDAGEPDQATMVLARVLNQKPKHAGARLELARALYGMSEYADAQQAFNKILTQNPPPAAELVAKNYLAAIDAQLKAKSTSITPFVEVRLGYSTNANGATANSQPFRGLSGVPTAVQDLALDQQSLEKSSTLLGLTTGVEYSRLLKPRWTLKAGGRLAGQSNPSAHFVDTYGLSSYALIEKRIAQNATSAGLDVARSYVDGEYSAKSLGMNLVASRSLSSSWLATAQNRIALSRYAAGQEAKDSTDYTLSVALAKNWGGAKQLGTNGSLIAQRVDSDTDPNSKDVLGLALGAQWLANASTLLTASAVYLEADYDAPIIGSTDRKDATALLSFGATYYSSLSPNLKWLLNLDANETRSSLNLFDADGVKLTVGVRYDFR